LEFPSTSLSKEVIFGFYAFRTALPYNTDFSWGEEATTMDSITACFFCMARTLMFDFEIGFSI
jgi:hypothetical protein